MAQIKRSQDVTRWLVEEHSFPATRPLGSSELVELDARTTVSFWVYYPQPNPPQPPTSAHMGSLLADLHAIPHPPPTYRAGYPLDSLKRALQGRA